MWNRPHGRKTALEEKQSKGGEDTEEPNKGSGCPYISNKIWFKADAK